MSENVLNTGPEEKALLMLAGPSPLSGAEAALAGITNPARFVWLANEHGIASFVLRNIDALSLSGALPPTEYQRLRNLSFKSVARNSFIMGATAEAAAILNEAGMEPVLLKGTALEMTVYGGSGLRPMTDADILFPKKECLKAWRLLQEQGFHALPLKSPLHKLILMHTGKHLPPLIRSGFSLEIHHALWWGKGEALTRKMIEQTKEISDLLPLIASSPAARFRFATPGSELAAPGRDRLRSEEKSEQKIPPGRDSNTEKRTLRAKIPPPGLHFLYLVSHLSKHEADGHSQLRLYNDLAAIISTYGAEKISDEAMSHAGEVGMKQELRDKLGILWKYMGVDLPVKYRFEPSTAATEKFIAFLGNPKNNPPADEKLLYRAMVRSIPGIHRKIIFLLGDIFPGFLFMKKRYGKSTVAGILPFYLVRPGKLLRLL